MHSNPARLNRKENKEGFGGKGSGFGGKGDRVGEGGNGLGGGGGRPGEGKGNGIGAGANCKEKRLQSCLGQRHPRRLSCD